MTAPVIDLEKWIAQKNNKGHAEREDRAAFDPEKQYRLAYGRSLIQRPRDADDPSREFCAEEGHVGRYLPELPAGAETTSLSTALDALAGALAEVVFRSRRVTELLRHRKPRSSSNHNGGTAWPYPSGQIAENIAENSAGTIPGGSA